MAPQDVFINLQVADLARSQTFYEAMGFTPHPYLKDETVICMTSSGASNVHIMIITPSAFRSFTPTSRICVDPKTHTEVLISSSAKSKEDVDQIVATATKAGGKEIPTPLPQVPGVYVRSYEDPDGHLFGCSWIDTSRVEAGEPCKPAE